MSPGRVSDAVMEASKTSAAVSSLAAFYHLPTPPTPSSSVPCCLDAERQTGTQVDTWMDKEGKQGGRQVSR